MKTIIKEIKESTIDITLFFIKGIIPILILMGLVLYIVYLTVEVSSYFALLIIPLLFVILIIADIHGKRRMSEI